MHDSYVVHAFVMDGGAFFISIPYGIYVQGRELAVILADGAQA